jgi:anti-sigma B factor antagonist
VTFEVQRHETPDGIRLVITGEVDLTTGPRLERELLRAESEGPGVTVDLTQVDFFDSTGLQILLDADIRASQNGHALVVETGGGEAARVMELARVIDRMSATVIR